MLDRSQLYTDDEAQREALAAEEAAERDAMLSREFLNALIELRDEADTTRFIEGNRLTGPVVTALPRHGWHGDDTYRDTGCELAPACLTCPLPRCRYDEPGGVGAAQALAERVDRNRRIVALRGTGVEAREIASVVGVSVRSVFRVLAEASS